MHAAPRGLPPPPEGPLRIALVGEELRAPRRRPLHQGAGQPAALCLEREIGGRGREKRILEDKDMQEFFLQTVASVAPRGMPRQRQKLA